MMEKLKPYHKTKRALVRQRLKMVPALATSVARRIADKLTRAYQRTFVSPEEIRVEFFKEQGFTYFTQGDFIKARDCFFLYLDHAHERDPSILYMLAMCFKNMDENQEAVDFLKRAEKAATNDPDIINALGECLFSIQEYPQAIVFLAKAIRITPGNPEIYFHLGVCYEKLKQEGQAEMFYKKAIALDARQAEYHQTLGLFYESLGRRKDAVVCFKRALDVDYRRQRGGG